MILTIRLRLPFPAVALAAALLAALATVPLTATPARAAAPICISGTLQYDYQSAEDGTAKPTRTKPLRNATVELWGAEKSTDSPRALNVVGLTAVSDGSYNVCYTPTTTTSLSTVWVKVWADSNNLWRVFDTNNQYITWQLPALSNVTGNRNTGTAKAPASTARAWHAFDTLNLLWWDRGNPASYCWSSHETNNSNCTPLTVRWHDQATGGSWDSDYTNTVNLVGPDADSEHYILHEGAHFLQHRMFNGPWPSSLTCDSHAIPYVSTEGCAWSEGFANAAAAYLLGDSRFVHSNGSSTSFTYGNGWGVGDKVEGNVAGSLLSLWRTVDTNWNGSIAAMTAQKPLTFSAYFNTTRPAANPPLSTGSTAVGKLNPHTIDYGPTIAGDGKYHSLTNGSALALERMGGCANQTSATAGLNTSDTTRSWQRWKVEANTDGTVRITDGCAQPLTLTAPSGSGGVGTVTLKPYNPADSYQKWKITKSNGTLKITTPQSGLSLDREGSTPGSKVMVTWSNSSNPQSWAPLD